MVFVQTPLLLTTSPVRDVFVSVTKVLVQTVSLGEIVKFAVGFCAVVIGSTVAFVNPQGFSARILTKNVFGVVPPVAPQEEEVKM